MDKKVGANRILHCTKENRRQVPINRKGGRTHVTVLKIIMNGVPG